MIREIAAMMSALSTVDVQTTIVMDVARINDRPLFVQLQNQIGQAGKKIFGNEELEGQCDGTVTTALSTKAATTQMANDLLADLPMLKPSSPFTQKRGAKSLRNI